MMISDHLRSWLLSSIAGIIVLGALGSLAAVLILKLFSWLSHRTIAFLRHYLPRQAERTTTWLRSLRDRWIYSSSYELSFRLAFDRPVGAVAFAAFHLAWLLVWLFCASELSLVSMVLLSVQRSRIVTTAEYAVIVGAFLAAYRAVHHLLRLVTFFHMLPSILRGLNTAQAERMQSKERVEPESKV
jgi:hypothetical protein